MVLHVQSSTKCGPGFYYFLKKYDAPTANWLSTLQLVIQNLKKYLLSQYVSVSQPFRGQGAPNNKIVIFKSKISYELKIVRIIIFPGST